MRQRWTGSWKSFLILRIWHGHLLGMDCSRWLRVVTLSIGFCNCLEPSLECFGDFLEELLRVWGMVTGILGVVMEWVWVMGMESELTVVDWTEMVRWMRVGG